MLYNSCLCCIIQLHIFNLHGTFCDRTGLIQTERVNSRQRFNTVKLLHKCLLCSKNHRTQCQCHTCQKYQAFRDHSKYCGNHIYHRILQCISYDHILLVKQHGTKRHDNDTDHLQNRIQRIAKFRIMTFKFLCFTCDLRCIIIFSNMDYLTASFP